MKQYEEREESRKLLDPWSSRINKFRSLIQMQGGWLQSRVIDPASAAQGEATPLLKASQAGSDSEAAG